MAIGLTGCKREAPIAQQEIQWSSKDDVVFHGTLHSGTFSKETRPPGFILLHSLNGSRADWAGLTEGLSEKGYMSLAYDMRGHGDSTLQSGEALHHQQFTQSDWHAAIEDVGLAKNVLLDAGADPENIFIIGSSLGANIGFKYAYDDNDIQGVVLLSPWLETKNIAIRDDMSDSRRLPVLLMASEGDSYHAGAVEVLKTLSPAYAEALTFHGSAHGTDLLMVNPQVAREVLLWLEPIVK